jgi:hypothetical protein
MKGSHILSGFIGAAILILVLLAITVWLKPFNYQAVYIVNPEIITADSLKTNSLTCSHLSVLQDLENKGVLLTPQEYTSHIADYYNTLVGFLIGLFVLFSFLSFWSIKSSAQKDIEEAKTKMKEEFEKAKETTKKELIDDLKDSQSFISSLIEKIIGHIEDDIVTKADKELIDKNIDDLTRKQIDLEENINLLFDAVDSKSEIIKN